MTSLKALAERAKQTELEVVKVRENRDKLLLRLHQEGISVSALARATGLSRQSVYNAMRRCS